MLSQQFGSRRRQPPPGLKINSLCDRWLSRSQKWAAPRDEPERLLNLARLYDEYVQTGLMDETRANATRQQAWNCTKVCSAGAFRIHCGILGSTSHRTWSSR